MKKRISIVLFIFNILPVFSLDILFTHELPDYAGNIHVKESSYYDTQTMWVASEKVALVVEFNLNLISISTRKTQNIAKAEDRGKYENTFILYNSKHEGEGLFLARDLSNWDFSNNNSYNDFLFDTKTGKQYRLNDPEDRAEILAAPEEVFRSFRYSYEGDNYEGFGRKEPFRIYRTDNYTLEKEVIWEAPVQEIFPGITFNAESHILDISEDGKNVLVSVGGGDKGSIFVADFDGTGLSNAREIMYDYVPDAVFVGNEYAVVPFDRMAVGTEGNGLWRLGIYDFEGNQVAVVEDVWVGDSINQFDVDEDGNQLVLVGIYKDEVGVYLFDIVR